MTLRSYAPYAFVLLSLSACSWLVSPEQEPIKCKVEKGGKDPCPKSMLCVSGECQASTTCNGGREICDDGIDNDCDDLVDEHNRKVDEACNQEDDDCDGMVDEGFQVIDEKCDQADNDCDGRIDEGFDQDNDGYTPCGDGTYKPQSFDCEPMNANAYPGNEESCDGLDNDCDGNTDDAPPGKPLCAANQLCSNGLCVAKTCAVPNSGVTCQANERCVDDVCQPMNCAMPCKEGQFCDTKTYTCVDVPQQRKNGESCTLDADCLSGTCIDSAALKLPETPRRVCGRVCCSDNDCGTGETCFASGTGARSCLPRALAVNSGPNGAGGAKICSVTGDCGMQVCSAGDSYQGQRRLATTVCRTPGILPPPLGPEKSFAESCANPASCNTRLCLPLIFSEVCSTPCRTSPDCAKLKAYNQAIRGYCQYVDLNQYSVTPPGFYAPICLASFDEKTTPPSCRANADCPDGTCLGASTSKPGKCAPTCCSDAQCKTNARPDARCVPVARGTGRFEMRCSIE